MGARIRDSGACVAGSGYRGEGWLGLAHLSRGAGCGTRGTVREPSVRSSGLLPIASHQGRVWGAGPYLLLRVSPPCSLLHDGARGFWVFGAVMCTWQPACVAGVDSAPSPSPSS